MKNVLWKFAVLFCLWVATVPAQAQDALGRTFDRAMQTEAMAHLGKEIRQERALIDRFSQEQREQRAIVMAIFERGAAGELTVELKVRHGGEASLDLKGVDFELEPSEDEGRWAVSSGSFDPPKKWKPLKITVTPPGQHDRKVVCQGTRVIAFGDRVAFCVIPLMTNGDLYCPSPDRLAAASLTGGPDLASPPLGRGD